MKNMKKSRLIILASLLLITGLLVPVQVSAVSAMETASVSMNAEQLFSGKNKKKKGYKKHKSKKILGIFKRKSDCGCPKHK